MKSSTKILIGVIIAISFLLGFFIGITVDYPKTDKQALSGTIGKMSNYRNVKVTDDDIHLRSDLLSNQPLLKSYRQFFNFHYSTCVKLCNDIDFAIKAVENVTPFREDNSMEIENVKQYRLVLEQARIDILLAVTSLQQLSEANENDITQVINNANIAVAQVKYKQNCLLTLVEAIEKFMAGNNPNQYSDLIKVHDMFAINQLIIAAVTNDKPMLKAYNNKKILSSYEDLNLICSNEQFKAALQSDFKTMQSIFNGCEKLNIDNTALIGNLQGQYLEIVNAIEKLGIVICSSSQSLGDSWCPGSQEKLGSISNSEKLGVLLNTEKLGVLLNSEKLGIYANSEKLGVLNFEKLAAGNVENLGIE